MSTSDLFVIGSSGLRSMRAQMGAISDNIANANTAQLQPPHGAVAGILGRRVERTALRAARQLWWIGSRQRQRARTTSISMPPHAKPAWPSATANSRVRWLTDIETRNRRR
jgi:hypothetical protein